MNSARAIARLRNCPTHHGRDVRRFRRRQDARFVRLSRVRTTATVLTAATEVIVLIATNPPAKAPTAKVAAGLEIAAAVGADATAAEAASPSAQSGGLIAAPRRSTPN